MAISKNTKLVPTLSDKPKDIEQFTRETTIKVLARTEDDSVKSRAHFLLEWLKMSFPGAQPDFNFLRPQARHYKSVGLFHRFPQSFRIPPLRQTLSLGPLEPHCVN